MTIKKEQNGQELCVSLEGRLDTTTSPMLEKEYDESLKGVKELVFDFAELRTNVIQWIGKRAPVFRWTVYVMLIFMIFLFAQIDENSFIYFQF